MHAEDALVRIKIPLHSRLYRASTVLRQLTTSPDHDFIEIETNFSKDIYVQLEELLQTSSDAIIDKLLAYGRERAIKIFELYNFLHVQHAPALPQHFYRALLLLHYEQGLSADLAFPYIVSMVKKDFVQQGSLVRSTRTELYVENYILAQRGALHAVCYPWYTLIYRYQGASIDCYRLSWHLESYAEDWTVVSGIQDGNFVVKRLIFKPIALEEKVLFSDHHVIASIISGDGSTLYIAKEVYGDHDSIIIECYNIHANSVSLVSRNTIKTELSRGVVKFYHCSVDGKTVSLGCKQKDKKSELVIMQKRSLEPLIALRYPACLELSDMHAINATHILIGDYEKERIFVYRQGEKNPSREIRLAELSGEKLLLKKIQLGSTGGAFIALLADCLFYVPAVPEDEDHYCASIRLAHHVDSALLSGDGCSIMTVEQKEQLYLHFYDTSTGIQLGTYTYGQSSWLPLRIRYAENSAYVACWTKVNTAILQEALLLVAKTNLDKKQLVEDEAHKRLKQGLKITPLDKFLTWLKATLRVS